MPWEAFIAIYAWAMHPPFGSAVCHVNFNGTTYDWRSSSRGSAAAGSSPASIAHSVTEPLEPA